MAWRPRLVSDWRNKGLNREEAHASVRVLQMRDAGCCLLIFDRYAEPHMRRGRARPVTVVNEFHQERTAFRQHLINVPVGLFHRVEHGTDVRLGNVLVKEIAHRVDEDHARPLPIERLLEALGPQGEIETSLERMPGHAAKAFREPGRIAVIATDADFGTAGYWIPRRVGPFDGGVVSHAPRSKSHSSYLKGRAILGPRCQAGVDPRGLIVATTFFRIRLESDSGSLSRAKCS
jgi:hypothetical protein